MYRDGRYQRWIDNQHNVKFIFISREFDNSFNALNTIHALLNVYLQKKISPWCNKFQINCVHNNILYSFFCRSYNQVAQDNNKNKNKNINFDSLIELGWMNDNTTKSHKMHIGYILKLQSAVTRAMNWFTPKMNLKYEKL
jgi:hypothetical protein